MSAGAEFVKKIKPIGCVLFLGLFVLMTVLLFTLKLGGVAGYTAPQSSEYYAQRLEELTAELNENLIPLMKIQARCEYNGEKIVVTASGEDISVVKSGIIYYYDSDFFEFREE